MLIKLFNHNMFRVDIFSEEIQELGLDVATFFAPDSDDSELVMFRVLAELRERFSLSQPYNIMAVDFPNRLIVLYLPQIGHLPQHFPSLQCSCHFCQAYQDSMTSGHLNLTVDLTWDYLDPGGSDACDCSYCQDLNDRLEQKRLALLKGAFKDYGVAQSPPNHTPLHANDNQTSPHMAHLQMLAPAKGSAALNADLQVAQPQPQDFTIDKIILFSTNDFEAIISLVQAFPKHWSLELSRLYRYQERYYLALFDTRLMSVDFRTDIYLFLTEYMNFSDQGISLLEEYGQVIMAQDVFYQIHNYFLRGVPHDSPLKV